MANVTDPLIKSVQGSDPQNLMEYITRQKIYDSRFWKEECFGLNAADVLERAAKSLTCVGGTYSGIGKPTKFLALTLKLLQLQPEQELIETFLEQEHFKYLRVLGAFYLRLTGRPQDIYELLEPLYADYSKLRYRGVNEWKLIHVDEFIDELLTKPFCCGIAMPRLPMRETLQEAGYLEDGPRLTALEDALTQAGGVKEYLKVKVDREQSEHLEGPSDAKSTTIGAIALWEKRYGRLKKKVREQKDSVRRESSNEGTEVERNQDEETNLSPRHTSGQQSSKQSGKRKGTNETDDVDGREKKKKKKEKKKAKNYGCLFKSSSKKNGSGKDNDKSSEDEEDEVPTSDAVDKNSEEYWNNLRSSLGLNPLKK